MEIEIAGAEEAEAARLFGAGRNLGHGQGLEQRLQRVEQVEVLAARGMFAGANENFLRAAAGRDQADAGFDQADVGLGGRLDARAVQADFAAAAQRQSLRRDHDRARRVLEREIGVLEVAHGEVQVVPFLLLRGDQEQQEIGAGGKIHRLVGDDHGVEILGEALHAGLEHGADVVADGVHLGVKFAAEDAVAEIDEAGAGVLGDFARALVERFQDDDAGRLGDFREAADGRIERRKLALRGFVEALLAGREQARDQRRQLALFLREALRPCARRRERPTTSNGPSSQAKPQRMARSTSAIESEISGTRRAA